MKRYNLVIPESLWDKIQELSYEHDSSALEIMRRLFKIGLYLHEAQKNGSQIIIRTGEEEKEIVIL